MRRNVPLLLAMSAMHNAQFLTSIWLVYLETRKGVGLEQFLLIEGLYALAMVVMEIPSGWISDRFRRISVLRFAELMLVLSMLALLLLDGLLSVVACQVLMGIGFSFSSGTHQAALYESLAAANRKNDYTKVEGLNTLLAGLALALATLAGSGLLVTNPNLPVIAYMSALGVSFLCAWALAEPPRPKGTHSDHMLHNLKVVLHSCFKRTVRLKAYLFINALLFATLNVLYWMQQPYMGEAGIGVAWFGPILFVDSLLGGLGGWLAGRLAFKLPRTGITAGAAVAVVLLGLVALLPLGYAGIGMFFALGLVWGYTEVLVAERLQHLALPHMRATVLSMASFMRQGWFFIFSLIAARALEVGGLPLVYATAAAILALALPCCLGLLYGRRWLHETLMDTVVHPTVKT
ncbi:MAG: MFS transporter [Pseudomonadaceae bacterium]|nr:MFS transporter [Pseudomonadaceae bacterium]